MPCHERTIVPLEAGSSLWDRICHILDVCSFESCANGVQCSILKDGLVLKHLNCGNLLRVMCLRELLLLKSRSVSKACKISNSHLTRTVIIHRCHSYFPYFQIVLYN